MSYLGFALFVLKSALRPGQMVRILGVVPGQTQDPEQIFGTSIRGLVSAPSNFGQAPLRFVS